MERLTYINAETMEEALINALNIPAYEIEPKHQTIDDIIINEFRNQTEKFFENINGLSAAEIELEVKDYLKERIEYEELEVEIIDVIVAGSRCRGLESETSDLDIIVEFKSPSLKEDSLFNILHEEEYKIGGIDVDFNPISKDDFSGSLAEYLPRVEQYLQEKMIERDIDLLKRNADAFIVVGTGPMCIGEELVSFPIEYEDFFNNKELKRLETLILEKTSKDKKKEPLENKINKAKESLNLKKELHKSQTKER